MLIVSSIIAVVSQIIKNEGLLGMYRGFGISLLIYAPYSAIWWLVYSTTRDNLVNFFPQRKYEVLIHAASGVSAATVAGILFFFSYCFRMHHLCIIILLTLHSCFNKLS